MWAEARGFWTSNVRRNDLTAPVGEGGPRFPVSNAEGGGGYGTGGFQAQSSKAACCHSPFASIADFQFWSPLFITCTAPSSLSMYKSAFIGVVLKFVAGPRRSLR